jgi:hypothetical protein
MDFKELTDSVKNLLNQTKIAWTPRGMV